MPRSSDIDRIDSTPRGEEEAPRKEEGRKTSSALVRGEIVGKESRRGVDEPDELVERMITALNMINDKEIR